VTCYGKAKESWRARTSVMRKCGTPQQNRQRSSSKAPKDKNGSCFCSADFSRPDILPTSPHFSSPWRSYLLKHGKRAQVHGTPGKQEARGGNKGALQANHTPTYLVLSARLGGHVRAPSELLPLTPLWPCSPLRAMKRWQGR
jgi:hypothetical protein